MLCIHVWNSTDNASDVSGNDAQLRSESGHDILTAKFRHFLTNNKQHQVITEERAVILTRGHPHITHVPLFSRYILRALEQFVAQKHQLQVVIRNIDTDSHADDVQSC